MLLAFGVTERERRRGSLRDPHGGLPKKEEGKKKGNEGERGKEWNTKRGMGMRAEGTVVLTRGKKASGERTFFLYPPVVHPFSQIISVS